MTRTVLVPVADGTEELEAVAIIDTLRRAGAAVTVAAVGARLEVTCSRGREADGGPPARGPRRPRATTLIALPGGMPGAQHLHDSPELTALLRAHAAAGGLLAAVCAAPVVVLARHGLLGAAGAPRRIRASSRSCPRPSVREARVVVDDGLITSRGAGTALEFALALVEQLYGPQRRDEVARAWSPRVVLADDLRRDHRLGRRPAARPGATRPAVRPARCSACRRRGRPPSRPAP